MKRRDSEAITRMPDEWLEGLADRGVPKTATAIIRKEGANMPYTTRGANELADNMQAKRRVIEEAHKLDAAMGETVAIDELKGVIRQLESDVRALRDENAQLRTDHERLTAKDAMAISSGGSQR